MTSRRMTHPYILVPGDYRQPPGQPPPILAESNDAILSGLLAHLFWRTSARERVALAEMLQPLREWARRRYHPFPDVGNADVDPVMEG